MKKLYSILKKLGFTKMAGGWGDTWTLENQNGEWEVQISHKDYRGPAAVYIERKNKQGWRDLTLKDAASKLQQLFA